MKVNTKKNTVLISIIVILSILIGIIIVNSVLKNNEKKNTPAQLSVLEYRVYDYKDLDFRFVLAEITLSSEEKLNIPFSDITINNLSLDTYKTYLTKARDLEKLDALDMVDESFVINDDFKTVSLFIPILDEGINVATLSSDYFEDLVFDLTKNLLVFKKTEENINEDNNKDPEKEPVSGEDSAQQEQVIQEDLFEVIVKKAYTDSNFDYSVNGENYTSSSNEVMHIIPVELVSNDGSTYEITDAKFIFKNTGSEVMAENGTFTSTLGESIINKKTDSRLKGSLIFFTYTQSLAPVDYEGQLLVKINGGEWLELEVVI